MALANKGADFIVENGVPVELDLVQADVTDADLRHLKDLPDLFYLNLNETTTDDGLAHLKSLKKLQSLDVFVL